MKKIGVTAALLICFLMISGQANALTFTLDGTIGGLPGVSPFGTVQLVDNPDNIHVDFTVTLNDPLRTVNILNLNWNLVTGGAFPAAFVAEGGNIGAYTIALGLDNVGLSQAFDIRIADTIVGNPLTFSLRRGNSANIDPDFFLAKDQFNQYYASVRTNNFTGETGEKFYTSASVPEPMTMLLLGLGLVGLAGVRRNFRM